MEKTRILVIDDSAIVRELLEKELNRQPDMTVVATAGDPFIAREKLSRIPVDVIILDIEMPRMDGLTFLKYLMKYHPLPVVVLSSLVDAGNDATLAAMELGAVGIIPKPGGPFSVMDVLVGLVTMVRDCREVDFERIKDQARRIRKGSRIQNGKRILSGIKTTNQVICVGASTGGTTALELLFRSYDRILPPTLAVIHMPERFTGAFAKRLDSLCQPTIKEAEDGEPAVPGYVYIAPGNFHMTLRTMGAQFRIKLHSAPRLHGQRPAVDPLFESAARNLGANSMGILLTGMGKDGATGLLEMKQAGAYTICQDEATSVVFGMPKAGIDIGAATAVLGLDEIYPHMVRQLGTE